MTIQRQCREGGEAGYDRLHKLRPVIDVLNSRLKEVYIPSSVVAVVKNMVQFKGRSSMKQYMQMKPVKRGYKVWCPADTRTGFVNQFDIYIYIYIFREKWHAGEFFSFFWWEGGAESVTQTSILIDLSHSTVFSLHISSWKFWTQGSLCRGYG